MTVLYLAALAVITLSLSALMPRAWVVKQQRTGNSGWVDTVWTFLVGAGAALWPVAGAASAAGAALDVLDPGLRDRHPAAGGADAAFWRQGLSRLPVPQPSIFPAAAASMKGVVT